MVDIQKKYEKQIRGIAKTNDVTLSVAEDMFINNMFGRSHYPGGGVVTHDFMEEVQRDVQHNYGIWKKSNPERAKEIEGKE